MTDLIALLEVSAYSVWSASLNGTEHGRRLSAWLGSPEIGDLVLEISTVGTGRGGRFGRLTAVEKEFVAFEEEEGGYWDTFWYVELPDGTTTRWSNCRFIRVLESVDQLWKAEKGEQP